MKNCKNLTHYLPEVHSGMKNSTKIRPDLHVMLQVKTFLDLLLFSLEIGEPEVCYSVPTVVGSLAYRANYFAKVSAVEFYESGIDIVEHRSSIAFWNFYHSWVSVLMDHSDLDFGFVIIFIKAMRDI